MNFPVNIGGPKFGICIAETFGVRLSLDEATMNKTFGHFARVLINVDLGSHLPNKILVRNDFDFYVDIEKLSYFCISCQIIGHSLKLQISNTKSSCKFGIDAQAQSSTFY